MDSLFLEKLHTLSLGSSLPEYSYLMELSDNVCSVLETENPAYRPLSKSKVPGGLIDFTGGEPQKLPVIVVPDLHARAFFLYNILRFTLPADFLADGKKPLPSRFGGHRKRLWSLPRNPLFRGDP